MKPRHPEKVNKPINPIKKKPEWIRSKILDSKIFFETKQIVNAKSTSPSMLTLSSKKVLPPSLMSHWIGVLKHSRNYLARET